MGNNSTLRKPEEYNVLGVPRSGLKNKSNNLEKKSDNIVHKNSLMYWYPKIMNLPIPQPETLIWKLPKKYLEPLQNEEYPHAVTEEAHKRNTFGYPVFLRTDQASNKHNWDKAAYVESKEKLGDCIFKTIVHNLCADVFGGLPFEALVFRKYIPMDSKYTAFWGNMPVNPERRYFFKDGKVLCHHHYWIEEAIQKPSIKMWKEVSRIMNHESKSEIKLLTKYTEMVAKQFEGCWSVDFCKSAHGTWYLIDMAMGKDSWHPKDCMNEGVIR